MFLTVKSNMNRRILMIFLQLLFDNSFISLKVSIIMTQNFLKINPISSAFKILKWTVNIIIDIIHYNTTTDVAYNPNVEGS